MQHSHPPIYPQSPPDARHASTHQSEQRRRRTFSPAKRKEPSAVSRHTPAHPPSLSCTLSTGRRNQTVTRATPAMPLRYRGNQSPSTAATRCSLAIRAVAATSTLLVTTIAFGILESRNSPAQCDVRTALQGDQYWLIADCNGYFYRTCNGIRGEQQDIGFERVYYSDLSSLLQANSQSDAIGLNTYGWPVTWLYGYSADRGDDIPTLYGYIDLTYGTRRLLLPTLVYPERLCVSFLFWLAVVFSVGRAWTYFKKGRRRPGACPRCSYSLLGISPTVCPECGQELEAVMTEQLRACRTPHQ